MDSAVRQDRHHKRRTDIIDKTGIIDKYASLINKDARASDGDVGGVS